MVETSSDTRPDVHEYLMSIAVEVATRTNCRRTAVGALIVRDGRIISTGYNGTIPGYTNCLAGGCPRCSDPAAESRKALAICRQDQPPRDLPGQPELTSARAFGFGKVEPFSLTRRRL